MIATVQRGIDRPVGCSPGSAARSLQVSIVACWLALGMAANARLGETPKECQQRYGQPVTNYPGRGDVAGAEVYVKDGIAISVVFVRKAGGDTRAGLVLYSRLRPDAQGHLLLSPKITDEEEATLLATVAGRWENYDPPPAGLGGKPAAVIPMPAQPSLTVKQRDIASKSLRKPTEALYPSSRAHSYEYNQSDVAHNGPKIFAFRIMNGLAIYSYDAVAPISAWADQILSERERAKETPKSKLTGF